MPLLQVKDLRANVGDKEILKGLDLTVNAGEVHAVMGPNGSGKSTLAQVLAGNPAYEVTGGTVTYDGKDLLALAAEERAQQGIFLAFQYPVEIPGVSNAYFLRAAYNEIRKAKGLEEVDPLEFADLMEQKLAFVDMSSAMLTRSVNMGFSGGEKKRNEILQMAVLEPRLAILDETDSGLDIDALRIVADGVNKLKRPENATIVVTHYQRLLNYIVPDFVHVLANGRILKSGGKDLALELEEKGYDWVTGGSPAGGGGVTTLTLDTTVESYLASFDQLASDATAPAWVQSIRRAAFERFTTLGFPTTKNEDWHYTSVATIADQEFVHLATPSGAVQRGDLGTFEFGGTGLGWHTMVFVNGRFAPELSDCAKLPKGVKLWDLASAWTKAPDVVDLIGKVTGYDGHAFTALNTAFMVDGAVLQIAKDTEVANPIHLVFVTDANAAKGMMHPRNLIHVGRNAKATVIESYVSTTDAMYFTNAVSEVSLAEGSTLQHYKLQRESERAFHVGTIEAAQQRDSHYVSFTLSTGGALSRTNVYTTLDGPGSGATLNGLSMLDGEQHSDIQTQIIHSQPNCFSRELYKAVLDGRSHGVFNGKVYVHPEAQKTDGKQTNNTLLLSDTAQIDTKPQLEIFADDVKCTHGATVGQIDQTALFYMKSRGIGGALARRLLTYAFAADVLETIEVDVVRDGLERMSLERFV